MSVKKCPHCDKCFFDIDNDVCPFCGKDLSQDTEIPDFMKDIFGGFDEKE